MKHNINNIDISFTLAMKNQSIEIFLMSDRTETPEDYQQG
jgi:myo-inositol-hexaphosphate 3-phosphohydrolase